jgi:hypothetical protein
MAIHSFITFGGSSEECLIHRSNYALILTVTFLQDVAKGLHDSNIMLDDMNAWHQE